MDDDRTADLLDALIILELEALERDPEEPWSTPALQASSETQQRLFELIPPISSCCALRESSAPSNSSVAGCQSGGLKSLREEATDPDRSIR